MTKEELRWALDEMFGAGSGHVSHGPQPLEDIAMSLREINESLKIIAEAAHLCTPMHTGGE
jgi:hypothetical protein